VQIAPLCAGLLHEIADLNALALQQDGAVADEMAIIVPLRTGCVERARELLQRDPPLDPASVGMTSQKVYLDHDKAIFVFRAPRFASESKKAMAYPRPLAGRSRLAHLHRRSTSHGHRDADDPRLPARLRMEPTLPLTPKELSRRPRVDAGLADCRLPHRAATGDAGLSCDLFMRLGWPPLCGTGGRGGTVSSRSPTGRSPLLAI